MEVIKPVLKKEIKYWRRRSLETNRNFSFHESAGILTQEAKPMLAQKNTPSKT